MKSADESVEEMLVVSPCPLCEILGSKKYCITSSFNTPVNFRLPIPQPCPILRMHNLLHQQQPQPRPENYSCECVYPLNDCSY